MLETFTLETFRRHVGEDFYVAAGQQTNLTVRLTSAADLSDKAVQDNRRTGRTPFSLLFHGPADTFIPQGTYTVRHQAMGEFPLFLVPLGPQDGHMRYEAIFT